MEKRKSKIKSADIVTIKDAPGMTAKGRRELALWLRKQADFLTKDDRNFTRGRYVGRNLYS